MSSISSVSVLVVEDDPDSGELLTMFLRSEGAEVRLVDSADAARRAIEEKVPDVVVTDVTLAGEDGFSLVASLRADARTRDIPAIAITGHSDARSRSRALENGFQKFLVKPLDIFSLAAAIASVAVREPAFDSSAKGAGLDSLDTQTASFVAGRDVRSLLATLNAQTPYRYTSILRFDDDVLRSIWSFDRDNDRIDSFPADLPVESSYCGFVRASRTPMAITDAAKDVRVADHVKREELRSYCGVPIFAADGSIFGTICHYDSAPFPVRPETIATIERVAKLLAEALPPI